MTARSRRRPHSPRSKGVFLLENFYKNLQIKKPPTKTELRKGLFRGNKVMLD
jgi:hypothetical protein